MIIQSDTTTNKLFDKESVIKLQKDFKKDEIEVKKQFPPKEKKKDIYRTGN